LFTSISTTLFSQQKTFKIDYGFYVSDEILNIDPDKETDEAKKDLAMIALLASMFQEDGQPVAEVWVNDDFLRIYSNGPLQKTLQITNKTTQESFILYPDYNQYPASSPASDKMLDL